MKRCCGDKKSLSTATDPTWRSSICKLIGASSSRLQGTMVQPKYGKAVTISPNGWYIAAASENGFTVVSDVTNDTQHLLQHTSYITSIAFAQGGKAIVTGSLAKTAQLWDVDNGEKRGDPVLHTGAVSSQTLATQTVDFCVNLL